MSGNVLLISLSANTVLILVRFGLNEKESLLVLSGLLKRTSKKNRFGVRYFFALKPSSGRQLKEYRIDFCGSTFAFFCYNFHHRV